MTLWCPVRGTDISEEHSSSTHFCPEDGGDIFLRKIGNHLEDYTAL
jgi:hypothetical protein